MILQFVIFFVSLPAPPATSLSNGAKSRGEGGDLSDEAWAESEAALGELRVKKKTPTMPAADRNSLPILWAVTLPVLSRFVP